MNARTIAVNSLTDELVLIKDKRVVGKVLGVVA